MTSKIISHPTRGHSVTPRRGCANGLSSPPLPWGLCQFEARHALPGGGLGDSLCSPGLLSHLPDSTQRHTVWGLPGNSELWWLTRLLPPWVKLPLRVCWCPNLGSFCTLLSQKTNHWRCAQAPARVMDNLQLSLVHRGPSGNASPKRRCWGGREWVLALLSCQKGVFRIMGVNHTSAAASHCRPGVSPTTHPPALHQALHYKTKDSLVLTMEGRTGGEWMTWQWNGPLLNSFLGV